MLKKITLYLFGLAFICLSCIEQFTPDLNPDEIQSLLVVEGQITDEEGPFRIKVTSTFEINELQLYPPPVYGAEVIIFDSKGNHYQLYHTLNGWYETEDTLLQGVPGTTYVLNIKTADGTQYESTPVLMQDVPEIDSVYFEETAKTRFDDGEAIDENWLDIVVDSKDPTGQTKYWKWDFEETWEIKIPTDSLIIQHGSYSDEPELVYFTTERVNINPETEVCWVTMPSKNIHIYSSDKNQRGAIKRMVVNSIGPNDDRLFIKYSILVKQTAISNEVYDYLDNLKEANELSGGIYDKTPSQIFGNINNCNGFGKALGYFTASAIKSKRIFINFYESSIKAVDPYSTCFYIVDPDPKIILKYYFGTIDRGGGSTTLSDKVWTFDMFCNDCREYGTSVKPDFWED